jgi:hypothetical protein
VEPGTSAVEPNTSESPHLPQANDPKVPVGSIIPEPNLTEEQIALFELRFENGYDLYVGQDYVTWLQLHHPNALPEELSGAHSTDLESRMNVVHSTPIRDHQDELLVVSESPQNDTPQASTPEVND